MKKIIIVWLFLNSLLFAQNFELKKEIETNLETSFEIFKINLISEKELEIVVYPNIDYLNNCTMKYLIKHIDGISCIVLDQEIGKDLVSIYCSREKYTQADIKTGNIIPFIACEYKYENQTFQRMYGNIMGAYPNLLIDDFQTKYYVSYKSSSYLKENTMEYTHENLSLECLTTPWVEGVPGSGIGEYIEINDIFPVKENYLLIMNGYFSTDKPYLYKSNNRVKTVNILDTPHPQTVDISFLEMQETPEDFRITIMDVYKGTKYDDTCINCLIPWFCEVIPYENSIE